MTIEEYWCIKVLGAVKKELFPSPFPNVLADLETVVGVLEMLSLDSRKIPKPLRLKEISPGRFCGGCRQWRLLGLLVTTPYFH